jgi:hypothetical protein
MRQKTLKTVVTFASTADAMACETCAKQFGIPGRIIPVPSAISAGCGLAWCAEQQDRSALVEALNAHALAYEGIHEVELY